MTVSYPDTMNADAFHMLLCIAGVCVYVCVCVCVRAHMYYVYSMSNTYSKSYHYVAPSIVL